MVVLWWFYGGSMVVLWWFYGGSMVAPMPEAPSLFTIISV